MPTQVPIGIFNVAKTVVDKDEVKRWMEFIGAEFEIPDDGAVSNPALLIALAGKRCYMSFDEKLNPNISRIRKDYAEYFDNILKSGHGSVLEHSVFTFSIENVSRVFTAEMNRHRAGWAISEGSLRFIRFGENIPYWMPTSIQGPDVLTGETAAVDPCWAVVAMQYNGGDIEKIRFELNHWLKRTDAADHLDLRKQLTREVFKQAFASQEEYYKIMEVIWDMDESDHNFSYKKKVTSMMRRIIGLGVATGGVWSGNVRALRHVMTMRCSKVAEEEILHVFSRIAKRMQEQEPLLFGDFYQDDDGFWQPKYVKV